MKKTKNLKVLQSNKQYRIIIIQSYKSYQTAAIGKLGNESRFNELALSAPFPSGKKLVPCGRSSIGQAVMYRLAETMLLPPEPDSQFLLRLTDSRVVFPGAQHSYLELTFANSIPPSPSLANNLIINYIIKPFHNYQSHVTSICHACRGISNDTNEWPVAEEKGIFWATAAPGSGWENKPISPHSTCFPFHFMHFIFPFFAHALCCSEPEKRKPADRPADRLWADSENEAMRRSCGPVYLAVCYRMLPYAQFSQPHPADPAGRTLWKCIMNYYLSAIRDLVSSVVSFSFRHRGAWLVKTGVGDVLFFFA